MNKDISLDSSSFGLIRTNVRLTGNIKITVDSNEKVWLNTIDSNDALSNDKYKHYAVIDGWSHPQNVSNLFGSDVRSIKDILFDVKESVNPSKIANNLEYADQYDFGLYFAGAKYLNDKIYNEKMSYFAPLYLQSGDIPEYFVILKIDGAINENIQYLDDNKEEYYKSENYMYELLKRSSIIKTFSLKDDSRIGSYIRSMITDVNYPSCALKVNFNKDMFTYWYGLNVETGTYSYSGELMYDYYTESQPIKKFEEKITDGYKMNGLLYPFILNLEFLFDDDTSEAFDHNRYVGFYVNGCDVSNVMVDNLRQKSMHLSGNYPIIYNNIDSLLAKNIIINNEDGVKLAIKNTDVESDKFILKKGDSEGGDNLVIGYLKDKNDKLHRIKNFDGNSIQLSDHKINLKDFLGSDEKTVFNDFSDLQTNMGKSFISFSIDKMPKTGEKLYIYHIGGSRMDKYGSRYDVINFIDGITSDYEVRKLYGDAGEYYNEINVKDNFNFSVSIEESGSISGYELYNYRGNASKDSDVTEKCKDPFDYVVAVDTFSIEGVTIYEGYFVYLDSNGSIKYSVEELNTRESNYYAAGILGSPNETNHVANAVTELINSFPQKQFIAINSGNEIIISYTYGGDYNNDLSCGYEGESITFKCFCENDGRFYSVGGSNYENVVLVDKVYKDSIDIKNHVIKTVNGYSYIKEVSSYAGDVYRSINQSEIDAIFAEANDKVAIIPEKYEKPVLKDKKVYITSEYKIPIGFVSFYNVKDFDYDYLSSKYGSVEPDKIDEDGSNDSIKDDDDPIVEIKTKCLADESIDNEYDFLKENYYKEFAFDHKLSPYVCKWRYKNGYDVHGFPYRLNTSEIFGENNLSPVESVNINSDNMTNEWFYIISSNTNNDNYINVPLTINADKYVEGSFKDFTEVFTKIKGGREIKKYSIISYNSDTDKFETFFKGQKIIFRELDIDNVSEYYSRSGIKYVKGSRRYDNYKFTCVLRPRLITSDEYNGPVVKYYLIDDSKEKFIMYLIDLYFYKYDKNIETYIKPDDIYNFIKKSTKYKFAGVTGSHNENNEIHLYTLDSNGYFVISENCDGVDIYINDIPKFTDESIKKGDCIFKDETGNYTKGSLPDDDLKKNIKTITDYCSTYKSIYGDHRIKFDGNDEYSLCNFTYTHLYTMASEKFLKEKNCFSTIRIPSVIITDRFKEFNAYSNTDHYFTELNNEILNNEPYMQFFYKNSDSGVYYIILPSINTKDNMIDENVIPMPVNYMTTTNKMLNYNYLYKYNDDYLFYYRQYYHDYVLNVENAAELRKTVSNMEQFLGGKNYYRNNVFKKLIFNNIKRKLSSFSYEVVLNNTARCEITFDDPTIIEKSNYQKISSVIGAEGEIAYYNYESSDVAYDSKTLGYKYLLRYSGKYVPIYSNVIEFKNNYEKDKPTLYNIKFNTEADGFGKIKDFAHLKVSDHQIYNSYFDENHNSEYFIDSELTGNTTIGYSDFDVFKTSWDADFHKKYTSVRESVGVPGTLRIEEDDTFVNNIIHLPNTISLTQFDVDEVDDVETFDISGSDAIFKRLDDRLKIKVNFLNVACKKMVQLGINRAFDYIYTNDDNKYLGTDFDKYVKRYIVTNILPLYKIDSVIVYNRKKSDATSSVSGISEKDFETLNINNFVPDKNVKINTSEDYIIDFDYSVKKNYNSLINLKIVLKLI